MEQLTKEELQEAIELYKYRKSIFDKPTPELSFVAEVERLMGKYNIKTIKQLDDLIEGAARSV